MNREEEDKQGGGSLSKSAASEAGEPGAASVLSVLSVDSDDKHLLVLHALQLMQART